MEKNNILYSPLILRISNDSDKELFNSLIQKKNIQVHNQIYSQLQELIKCQNPSTKIDNYEEYISIHLKDKDIYTYGVWIYYPWSEKLVHILDEEEFVQVRTNRNQYKITNDEQQELNKKKIGIVGLSIGHSIALTIVTERICGELRLADFDILELSNLNRLRTPLYNLGLSKTIIAAREIAEIDPFIKIKIFSDGVNNNNIDDFFSCDGKLDLFIEVCDGLDMKIKSRYKAKELKIPVVMDTNDRGMLDIERFDIEPSRDIFHGLLGDHDIQTQDMSPINKLDLIYKIVDIEKTSDRLKLSIPEIGKTITTWPQLASSTMLGAGITTEVVRKILLGQHRNSGRFYADFDKILNS